MRYQMVVFDIAGTTVADPGVVESAFIAALDATGCTVPALAQVRAWMGYAKPEAIGRLLDQPIDSPTVTAAHRDFVARLQDSIARDRRLLPLPAAEATFAQLRAAGLRVVLNTGFCADITTMLLRRLGWDTCIDAWVASDQVAAPRPAPDMIQRLMRQGAIADAGAVVKVGDTPVDILEARAAGVGLCVAVTTGAHSRGELAMHGPDEIIDTLAALPPLLGLPRSA